MLRVGSVERNNHLQEAALVFTSECPAEILVSLSIARLFVASNLGTPFKRHYFKNLEANEFTKLEALLQVGMPAKSLCSAF